MPDMDDCQWKVIRADKDQSRGLWALARAIASGPKLMRHLLVQLLRTPGSLSTA